MATNLDSYISLWTSQFLYPFISQYNIYSQYFCNLHETTRLQVWDNLTITVFQVAENDRIVENDFVPTVHHTEAEKNVQLWFQL